MNQAVFVSKTAQYDTLLTHYTLSAQKHTEETLT